MDVHEMYIYFQNKAMEHQTLFQIEIDVTSRCNAQCPFCFQGNSHEGNKKEMSLQMIIDLLDKLREMGTYHIGFSGGEPFARPDFLEILRNAKKRGFAISLITNAMLLSEEKIDELEKIGIDRITVSFHSIKKENYLKSFGISNPNLYDTALSNINYMIKKNISVGIAMTITKYNINDIEDTSNYFYKLGLSESDINYNLLLRGKNDIVDLLPDNNEIRKNSKYLMNKQEADKKRLLCSAGIISCSIDSYGNVYPCTFFNNSAGNLYEHNIKDIWENSHLMKIIRGLKEEMFTKCQSCNIKGKCNFCMATNLNETGNLFEPSDEFCKSRKERMIHYDCH